MSRVRVPLFKVYWDVHVEDYTTLDEGWYFDSYWMWDIRDEEDEDGIWWESGEWRP